MKIFIQAILIFAGILIALNLLERTTNNQALITSIIGLSVCAFGAWRCIRQLINADKYEFHNRTEGGVVEFPDYKSAVKFKFSVTFYKFFCGVWILFGLLAFLGIVNQVQS